MVPVALTIAGSDPSGGAGIQADLKTFHQHGVYGTSVITLLTVQNTCGVNAVRVLDPEFVVSQLDAVIRDIPPKAAKTGALGNAGLIEALAERASKFSFPLVVDPVMVSKHGARLLDGNAIEVLRKRLLPHAFLVTPNLPEAAELAEMEVNDPASMEQAAAAIAKLGPKNVLVTGGHLSDRAVDVLWSDGNVVRFSHLRIDSKATHGTGCVMSAAITARLALGQELSEAVHLAKSFVVRAIRTHPNLGAGVGPLNLHADIEAREVRIEISRKGNGQERPE